MNRRIAIALGSLNVLLVIILTFTGWAVGRDAATTSSIAARPVELAQRASIALQASYNTAQAVKAIPLRIVGPATCTQTKTISATAGNMHCAANVVGSRASGCIEVVGIYYDKLASFAKASSSVVPCPE